MARPGVMLYFDIEQGLKQLETASRCAVYDAIMEYAHYGVVPEFEDPLAVLAWELIRPRLDRDNAAYEKRVARRNKDAAAELPDKNVSNQIVQEKSVMEQNTTEQNITEHKRKEQILSQPNTEENGAAQLPVKKQFIPPTLDEVRKYCRENSLNVDARQFVDYYTAIDWNMGKNKMADWQAAVKSWSYNSKKKVGYFANLAPIGTVV